MVYLSARGGYSAERAVARGCPAPHGKIAHVCWAQRRKHRRGVMTTLRRSLPISRSSAVGVCVAARDGPGVLTMMRQGQVLVVTSTEDSVARTWRDASVVRTLLDMITFLERAGEAIVAIVLGGDFARDTEIRAFLREAYPTVAVSCR